MLHEANHHFARTTFSVEQDGEIVVTTRGRAVATASRVEVRYLLSEDMQDGRGFGVLTIVNPFLAANDPLIASILPP